MRLVCQGREDFDEVGNARLVFFIVMDGVFAVRLGPLDFLFDSLRFVEEINRCRRVVVGLAHLLGRFLEAHDARAVLAEVDIGDGEDFAIEAVEALSQVAGNFHVLLLVIADGDEVGLVQEDVRSHKGRIGQQAGRDGVAPLGSLILVLGHAFQFADIGQGDHHPAQECMFRDFRLDEERRFFRVQAGSQVDGSQLPRALM